MKTIKAIFISLATAVPILTAQVDREAGVPTRLNEKTIAQLQAQMASGRLTSVELTNYYLARTRALDQGAEGVNSIIELNPDALELAPRPGRLRHTGRGRRPVHGLPVLLPGHSHTGATMPTSVGSLALVVQ